MEKTYADLLSIPDVKNAYDVAPPSSQITEKNASALLGFFRGQLDAFVSQENWQSAGSWLALYHQTCTILQGSNGGS